MRVRPAGAGSRAGISSTPPTAPPPRPGRRWCRTQDLAQFVRDYSLNLALIRKLKAAAFADSTADHPQLGAGAAGQDPGAALALGRGDRRERVRGDGTAATRSSRPSMPSPSCSSATSSGSSARRWRPPGTHGSRTSSSGTIWPVEFDFWNGLTLAANYANAAEEERAASSGGDGGGAAIARDPGGELPGKLPLPVAAAVGGDRADLGPPAGGAGPCTSRPSGTPRAPPCSSTRRWPTSCARGSGWSGARPRSRRSSWPRPGGPTRRWGATAKVADLERRYGVPGVRVDPTACPRPARRIHDPGRGQQYRPRHRHEGGPRPGRRDGAGAAAGEAAGDRDRERRSRAGRAGAGARRRAAGACPGVGRPGRGAGPRRPAAGGDGRAPGRHRELRPADPGEPGARRRAER